VIERSVAANRREKREKMENLGNKQALLVVTWSSMFALRVLGAGDSVPLVTLHGVDVYRRIIYFAQAKF
jgi:hypothetical protein